MGYTLVSIRIKTGLECRKYNGVGISSQKITYTRVHIWFIMLEATSPLDLFLNNAFGIEMC